MSNQQFYRSSPTSKPFRPHEFQPQFKFMNTFNNKNLHKMMQLENKSKFFQGQLNPLLEQNHKLKSQLMEVQRLLQNSTEMLRNLLPIPSSPERKLALQLANIEGVSELIKQDWHAMKQDISECYQELRNYSLKIEQLSKNLQETIFKHQTQVQFLRNQHQSTLLRIQEEKDSIIGKLQTSIRQLQKQIEQKAVVAAYKQKQLSQIHSKHKKEVDQLKSEIKTRDNRISSLQEDINNNLREHQANKKLLIQHHQQLAAEKEKELREGYEIVIRMKEEEANKNIKQLSDYALSLQEKITAKEAQILQLYEVNSKYIAEKEQLTAERVALRQQLYATKQQSYKFSQEIIHNQEIIEGLHRQIKQGKGNEQSLKSSLEALNTKLQKLGKQKESMQIMHKLSLQGKDKELAERQEQFRLIRLEIGSNQRMIRLLQGEIKTKDQQIERARQFQQICKQLEKTVQSYVEKQREHSKNIQEYQDRLLGKEKQIQNLQAQNKLVSEKMQGTFREKMKQMMEEWKNKQRQIEEQHRDYLEMIKSEQARKDRQYGQYVQSLQNQFKNKISGLEQAIENGKKESLKLQAELSQIETDYRSKIKKIQQQHIQQIKDSYQKYQLQMETMKNLITTKQNQFATALKNKEKEHKQVLEMRKKQYDSKLNALQKNIENLKSNTGIADVENRYKTMLQKMKRQTEQEKQLVKKQKIRQLDSLKQSHAKSLQQQHQKSKLELKESQKKHEREIKQIQSGLNQQIRFISTKLEDKISILRQQLASEKQAHIQLKNSTEKQIERLINTVAENKNQLDRRDIQINQLQYTLGKKIKQMEKIDQLVAQKLKKKRQQYQHYMESVKNQCERMMSKTTAQCNQKIKQVQNDRTKFTTNLYNDFKQIKTKYQNQLKSVNRKYDELEKLFQQRPSREEDVKKINQLMLMKQKMDIEVREFEKKIVSANQIVKYLNLQLQNYKDMYDIFGSDGIDPTLAEKKRQQFENYIRNNIIQLAQSKIKRQQDKTKVGNIRRLMKQRQWRIKTQTQISKQTIFNQSSMNMIKQVEEEDEDQSEILQYKKGRYVQVTRKKKKVNRSQSYHEKLGQRQKQLRMMRKIQTNSKNATSQLRNNAEIFLSLINKSQKPAAEGRKTNTEYGKMSSKRRTQSTMQKVEIKEREGQKRYQLKDRILSIQN